MKALRIYCSALAAMLTFGVFGPASAQTTSESASSTAPQHSSESKGKQKSPRVWTNDDMTSLRTPADTYLNHEADAEATPPEQKKENRGPGNPVQPNAAALPDNADALEKLIAKAEADVNESRAFLKNPAPTWAMQRVTWNARS